MLVEQAVEFFLPDDFVEPGFNARVTAMRLEQDPRYKEFCEELRKFCSNYWAPINYHYHA